MTQFDKRFVVGARNIIFPITNVGLIDMQMICNFFLSKVCCFSQMSKVLTVGSNLHITIVQENVQNTLTFMCNTHIIIYIISI